MVGYQVRINVVGYQVRINVVGYQVRINVVGYQFQINVVGYQVQINVVGYQVRINVVEFPFFHAFAPSKMKIRCLRDAAIVIENLQRKITVAKHFVLFTHCLDRS